MKRFLADVIIGDFTFNEDGEVFETTIIFQADLENAEEKACDVIFEKFFAQYDDPEYIIYQLKIKEI